MSKNCYPKNGGMPVSGHLYKLVKRIDLGKTRTNGNMQAVMELGKVSTDDWWLHILAERNINGRASDFPKHFIKVCKCRKYINR